MSKQPSFLCGNCKREMCNDCREIAEEYQELLSLRKNALHTADYKVGKLERELSDLKRRAQMYEDISKAGVGEIITAWMDKEISQLFRKEGSHE